MLKLNKHFYWVHVFAFSPRYREGDLTLYALNLHNVTKRLQLPHPLFNKQVDKYLIKPSGPDGLLSKWVIFLVHVKLSPKVNFLGFCQNTVCWQGGKEKTQLFQVLTILNIQEVICEYTLIQVCIGRKWQPTPVILPGESQGWGSLVGCRLWDHTESDTTEVT